jgi:hypothetical protein
MAPATSCDLLPYAVTVPCKRHIYSNYSKNGRKMDTKAYEREMKLRNRIASRTVAHELRAAWMRNLKHLRATLDELHAKYAEIFYYSGSRADQKKATTDSVPSPLTLHSYDTQTSRTRTGALETRSSVLLCHTPTDQLLRCTCNADAATSIA